MARTPADWLIDLTELLTRIQEDCGLAATKRIVKSATKAVEKKARPAPRRKSGPHAKTKRFLEEWDFARARERDYQRATPAIIDGWIVELRQHPRASTKAMRDYIAVLEQRRDGIAAGKIKPPTRGEIRRQVAEAFARREIYGVPGEDHNADSYFAEKRKAAIRSVRRKRG
jgi:hypothetical protein